MTLVKKACALFVVTAMLYACASQPDQAEIVDASRTALIAAEMLETLYEALPTCGAGVPKACSRPEVVRDVHTAHVAAVAALDEYERAVNTSGFGSNAATTALTLLRASVQSYASTTAALRAQ